MATYYISTSGNDTTGDGSSALPWATIAKAHTSATSGDTIILKSSASSYLFTGMSIAKTLIFEGESTDYTQQVISGGGLTAQWTYTGAYEITFKNIKIENILSPTSVNTKAIFFRNGAGPVGLRFINSRMTNFTIDKESNSGGLFCTISASSVLELTRSVIDDFDQYTSTTDSALFYHRVGALNEIIITDSIITPKATGTSAVYNVFAFLGSTLREIEAKNLIINATGDAIAWVSGTFTTTDVTYSDFNNVTSSPSGTGNLTSDPLFVGAPAGNFNLKSSSPCRGAGIIP